MNRRNGALGGIACAGSGCLALVLIIAIIAVTKFASHSPTAEFKKHMTAGNEYYRMGAYKRAVHEYSGMIESRPNRWEGYFFRAMANYRLGVYDKAIADDTFVMKMPNINPQIEADARYNRGLSLIAKGDPKAAYADFDANLAYSPSNWDAVSNRATAALRIGKYDVTVRDMTTLIQRGGTGSGNYIMRGLGYLNLHKLDDALTDFTKASVVRPTDPYAWCDIAWVNYEKGNLSEAVKQGERSVTVNANIPMLQLNLGLYYAAQKDWGRALTHYRAGLVSKPASADLQGALRDIKTAKTRYPEAADTLQKAEQMVTQAIIQLPNREMHR